MTAADDFIASVLSAAASHDNPFALVRNAFDVTLAQAPDPEGRRMLLQEIEIAIDRALFPAGSLPLFIALLQQLRAHQSEAVDGGGSAQTRSPKPEHEAIEQ